jgi:hypothetical protein
MPEYVMAGEIGDLVVPTPNAEVWYLSHDTYGRQLDPNYQRAPADGVGIDVLLLRESDDFAPQGKSGRCILRRVYVTIGVQFGFARVRVTPISDFVRIHSSKTEFVPPPSGLSRKLYVIEVPVYAPCTFARARVEIVERGGRVEWLGLEYGYLPVVQVASDVARAG